MMTSTENSRAFRPIEAFSALRAVLRDPDDTSQVFRLIGALQGRAPRMVRAKLEVSRTGQALLAERPTLLAALRDRRALAAMPGGSLGRGYLEFLSIDHLTPDGLVEASEAGDHPSDDVDAWIGDRLRDSHDLWHVVTGYRGDLLGEASLLAFTFAQTRAPAIGLLVAAALVRADDPDARRLIADGFVRGLRAAWLPAVQWESLLALPLEQVRHQLRVGEPPYYVPFFASELVEGGLLAPKPAGGLRATASPGSAMTH